MFKIFYKKLQLIGSSKEIDYLLENLSLLLASGIPINEALDSIHDEIKSKYIKSIINQISEDVKNGVALSKALENTDLFSPYTSALLEIGEKSGRMVRI